MRLRKAVSYNAQFKLTLAKMLEQINDAGKRREISAPVTHVIARRTLRELGIIDPDFLERRSPQLCANIRQAFGERRSIEPFPKTLGLRDVRTFEFERVDAALGFNFARDFLGGALISKRIVVQRII